MAISRSEASPIPHETGEISARPKAGAGFESRIRHAYFWTVVGSTARYGAGFVISLVLAHLLTPSDYGLIGMMAVFTELLASVFDWSIGPAVVHFYEEGKANEIPQYFTFSFLLGVAFTLLLKILTNIVNLGTGWGVSPEEPAAWKSARGVCEGRECRSVWPWST